MNSDSAVLEADVQALRSVLPGLVILSIIFLFNFVSRVVIAPLLPEIEQDFGLSHTASGSFFLFISSGYFFSIICSGFVAIIFQHRSLNKPFFAAAKRNEFHLPIKGERSATTLHRKHTPGSIGAGTTRLHETYVEQSGNRISF